MTGRSVPARSQRGETLVEVLLAVVILAMVAVGAFTALTATMRTSEAKRETAVAEGRLRAAAERLQGAVGYVETCASAASYRTALGSLLPSGATVSVQLWNAPAYAVTTTSSTSTVVPTFTACPTSVADGGLQLITVTVPGGDGRSRAIDVVKRKP